MGMKPKLKLSMLALAATLLLPLAACGSKPDTQAVKLTSVSPASQAQKAEDKAKAEEAAKQADAQRLTATFERHAEDARVAESFRQLELAHQADLARQADAARAAAQRRATTRSTTPATSTRRTSPAPGQSYAPEPGNGRCGGSLPPCRIMQRESGGNIQAQNPRSSAAGKWQFLSGTWNGYGGYRSAKDAPESVQDAKAAELWNNGRGCSHWSAC